MSTPIRRQYLELKARYPGTILFFRLGDFYETFDDDAVLAADLLHITLTSKPMGKDLRVPLAGVPYHSIDGHVAKLVAAGHRVAICEQLAEADEAKGLVPRDVVRVVTAGTVTSDTSLDAAKPNYLGSIAVRGKGIAVALADITTGEVRLIAGPDAAIEAQRTGVAEMLHEEDGLLPPGGDWVLQRRPILAEHAVRAELARQWGEHAPSTLVDNLAEAAALAHILTYLRETYPAALGALQRVRLEGQADWLEVDAHTLRNLDVFHSPGKEKCLFDVLVQTRTAMGARLLRQWLARPLRDAAAIGARLDGVEWATNTPLEREQLRLTLRGMPDIGRLCGKIGATSAGPRDLHALRIGLRTTLDVAAMLQRSNPPEILAAAIPAFGGGTDALLALDAALDPDPPNSFDEGGVINPGFSAEIDSLRALTHDARGYLLGIERLERERTGIRTLKVGHNRVFGYYIEISSANAALVPAGYQRRQTLVGAERYVTEELKEHEARLNGARDRLVELERRAFSQLVETIAADLARIQGVADAVALVDVVLALGEVAANRGYVRPIFDDSRLHIRDGRHPVVEAALGPGTFVPNDCEFDETCQLVILTGPNMSGKSTFLRQVALIALMAQAGSFVPATSAVLPIFDRIFTRIGAQDDLAAGQSTFMVEMVETAQILHRATPKSLIILDEVGRGTSTFDGMAIARAVVEFLHNRREVAARTLFATHYHELTALADILPRVRNAHVAVREEGGDVVFEHRVAPGPSDRSYGIHVARLAGLPPAVIFRAEKLLEELQGMRPAADFRRLDPPLQPSLFGGPAPVEAALRALDIEAVTPLEAIQKLFELKALAREAGP